MGGAASSSAVDKAATVSEKDPSTFPTKGLRLSHALAFLKENQGKLTGKTSADVCEQIIKPMTLAHGCSYCDMLDGMGHPAVGEAEVFISHAWKCPFLDVLDALQHHFRAQPDIVIWFDLFSYNQHDSAARDSSWWSGLLKDGIGRLKHTVLVLAPWSSPAPLSRAWCLFELYCTFSSGCRFDIAVCPRDQAQLAKDAAAGAEAVAKKMLAAVDVRKSECSKAEDKRNIFLAVDKASSFKAVNALVREQVRKQLILLLTPSPPPPSSSVPASASAPAVKQQQLSVPAASSPSKQQVQVQVLPVDFHRLQGHCSRAEQLFAGDCLLRLRAALGEHHPDAQLCMYNLGTVYYQQDQFLPAEPLCVQLLKKMRAALGKDHADTLAAMSRLASLCQDKGDVAAADELYTECLERRRALLGAEHPDTQAALQSLTLLRRKRAAAAA